MEQYLIYIILAVLVLAIAAIGFAYSRKAVSRYGANVAGEPRTAPDTPQIYEKQGVNQQSDLLLGAVQSLIRGRIRFIWFGLIVLGVALFGLYALHILGVSFDFERTPPKMTIATVILAGAAVYGLRLISSAFCRIKLWRTGFEICGMFGTKAYEYKDVDFYLSQTIESKYAADGYRPVIMKTETFNWIWVCQVLFYDGRKPLLLKSSRYAWLQPKMQAAIDGLAQGVICS